MSLGTVEKHAARINLWTALLQRGFVFIAALFAVSIAGWGAIVQIFERVPWWAWVGITLTLAILTTLLATALRRWWAERNIKALDVTELAKQCIAFQQELHTFLVERTDSAPLRDMGQRTPEGATSDWARGVDHSRKTSARMVQRFGSRVLAINHLLKGVGIKPADLFAFDHRGPEIAAYIGAVGELLSRGFIHEARQMDPKDVRTTSFMG